MADVEDKHESTPSNPLEMTIDLSRAAFIFMNYQISRLDLLSPDLAHGVLLTTSDLRRALDARNTHPTVVHIVSLEQTIEFPLSMTPREGELVIAKHGLSAFHETGLARHLKDKHVSRVYICGLSSNAEVVATALAAQDIFGCVRVIEDAYVETDMDGFSATIDLLATLDMLTEIKAIEGLKDIERQKGGAVPESAWKTNDEKWSVTDVTSPFVVTAATAAIAPVRAVSARVKVR